MRHGTYYTPKAVPCECGSSDAYWHGPEDGARTYCCDACWNKNARAADCSNRIKKSKS